MHPALGEGLNGGLKGLFDRGRLGFIPGIDYANPDLSHFNCRHFWETGLISINPAPGWLARWTDRHGGPDNPFQALSMDAGLSPLLRGSHNPVAAVQSPDDAQSWVPGVWGEWQDRMMEHYAAIAAQRPHGPGAAAVFAAARQSQLVARTLKPYVKDPKTGADPLAPPVAYPGGENGEGTQRLRREPAPPGRRCSRCRWASGWPPSTPRATSTPTTTRRRRWCAISRSSRRA